MSKKIVIIPTFCESHLIRHQIPNIIDTVDPDYIVICEGMFPAGTEGNKVITQQWKDKYTLDGEGKRGFDFLELKEIVKQAQLQYPQVKIILQEMEYTLGMTSTECYKKATTIFNEVGIDVQEGDYIFPYEGDVFHHENSKTNIQYYLEQIEPGQGFRSIWVDYMQNFWYVEKCRIKPWLTDKKYQDEENYMSRRICFRYDKNGVKYENMLDNFMTVDYFNPKTGYGMLFPTDLITYHYAWIRPGKFRDLRCDQLQRHPGYWEAFTDGLDKCDEYNLSDIIIRPSQTHVTNGYVKFFSKLEHPKHIRSHELWKELPQETINNLTNYN